MTESHESKNAYRDHLVQVTAQLQSPFSAKEILVYLKSSRYNISRCLSIL